MSKLPAAAFKPLSEVVHLDLSNNKLVSVPDTSFHFLKKVRILELHDNEISDIVKGTFQVTDFMLIILNICIFKINFNFREIFIRNYLSYTYPLTV